MRVVDWHDFLEKGLSLEENLSPSMTIGVFDGVHRGHQALIKRVVSYGGTSGKYVPVVITFRENHKSEKASSNITSFEEKLEIFERLGVKITLVINFTESFRQMSGIEFLETLLKHGNIGFFAVGESFRCGYQQDTDAAAIRDFFASHNVPAEIVPEVMEGSLPISSSRIRSAIASGDIQLARDMLGAIGTYDLMKASESSLNFWNSKDDKVCKTERK